LENNLEGEGSIDIGFCYIKIFLYLQLRFCSLQFIGHFGGDRPKSGNEHLYQFAYGLKAAADSIGKYYFQHYFFYFTPWSS
jgi:hypothetical protein